MSKFTFKNYLINEGPRGRGKKGKKKGINPLPFPAQGGLKPPAHHHHAWKKEDIDRAIANNRANPNAFPLPDFTKPPKQPIRRSTEKPEHWTDEYMDANVPYRVDPKKLTLSVSLGLMDRWNHPRYPTDRKMSELLMDEIEIQRVERLGFHVEVMMPPKGGLGGNYAVMVGPKSLAAEIRLGAEQFVESHQIMNKYQLIAKVDPRTGVRENTSVIRERWNKVPQLERKRLDDIWINLGIWFGYGKPGTPGSKTISFSQFLEKREQLEQQNLSKQPEAVPRSEPVQRELPLDPVEPATSPPVNVPKAEAPVPKVEPSKPETFLQAMKRKLFGKRKKEKPDTAAVDSGVYSAAQRQEMFPYKEKDSRGEVVQGSGMLPGTSAGLDYKITTDPAGKTDFFWGDGSKSQTPGPIHRPEARDIRHISIESMLGREGLLKFLEIGDMYPNVTALRTSFMSSDGVLNMVLRPEFMSRLKRLFPKLERVYGEIVLEGRMEQGRWLGVSKDTMTRFQELEHISKLLPGVVVTKRSRGYEQQGRGPVTQIDFVYDTRATTPRPGREREAPFDPSEGGRGGRRLFDRGRLNITVNPTLGRVEAFGNDVAVQPREVPLHAKSIDARISAEKRKQLQDEYHEGLLAKKPGMNVYPVNTTQRFDIVKRAAQLHKTSRTDWSKIQGGDSLMFDFKVKPFEYKGTVFPEHGFTRITGWMSKDGKNFVIGHTEGAYSYMRARPIREPSKIPGDVPTVSRGKSPGLGIKTYIGLIKWAQRNNIKEIHSGGQVSEPASRVYRALKEMGFKVDIISDKGQHGNFVIHVPRARLPESVQESDKATFNNYWKVVHA